MIDLIMVERKLIVHVDVNNTILVKDTVQGMGVRRALSYHLAGIVWGNVSESTGEWQWLSTSPSLRPPCGKDCMSYYRHLEAERTLKGLSRQQFLDALGTFAEKGHEGAQFLPLLDDLMSRMSVSTDGISEALVIQEDDHVFHRLLPSFFNFLNELATLERTVRLFLRTFGNDAGFAVNAIEAFKQGEHPLFRGVSDGDGLASGTRKSPSRLEVCHSIGQVTHPPHGEVSLTLDPKQSTSQPQCQCIILDCLHTCLSPRIVRVQAVQDDYHYWSSCGFSTQGGKPVWLDLREKVPSCQPVFFDDGNFLSFGSSSGGIADLRVVAKATRLKSLWRLLGVSNGLQPEVKTFCSCQKQAKNCQGDSAEFEKTPQCEEDPNQSQFVCANVPEQLAHHFKDVVLVQTDLMRAIQDVNYFVDKLAECEQNFNDMLQRLIAAETCEVDMSSA